MITEKLIQWVMVFGGASAFFMGLCFIADKIDRFQAKRNRAQKRFRQTNI